MKNKAQAPPVAPADSSAEISQKDVDIIADVLARWPSLQRFPGRLFPEANRYHSSEYIYCSRRPLEASYCFFSQHIRGSYDITEAHRRTL